MVLFVAVAVVEIVFSLTTHGFSAVDNAHATLHSVWRLEYALLRGLLYTLALEAEPAILSI